MSLILALLLFAAFVLSLFGWIGFIVRFVEYELDRRTLPYHYYAEIFSDDRLLGHSQGIIRFSRKEARGDQLAREVFDAWKKDMPEGFDLPEDARCLTKSLTRL